MTKKKKVKKHEEAHDEKLFLIIKLTPLRDVYKRMANPYDI